MLVKMERFITVAVFSCTGSTSMADTISQETPVRHYSLKQNDRSCNQSTEVQSAVQQNDAITITKLSLPTERCDNELLDIERSALVIVKDISHGTGSLD